MSEIIYSQDEISEEKLTKQYTIENKKGNACTFTASYDERLIIDMPFVGQGDSLDIGFIDKLLEENANTFYYKVVEEIEEGNYSKTRNTQGWLRSGSTYFKELLKRHPYFFDDFNKKRSRDTAEYTKRKMRIESAAYL